MSYQTLSFLSNRPLDEQSTMIDAAVAVLQAGGLLMFPTETTYGAGVDATNPAAVAKLLRFKARREGKPLSIAVTDLEMAEKYVEVNDSAKQLYAQFLPGPVTVVSKGRGVVSPGVESEFGTLGVRIPAYPLVLEIVRRLGKPVTATSANGSGAKRPYCVEDILTGLSDAQKSCVDAIIDAGTLPENPPSTVIDTTLSTPVVFRQGDVQAAAGSDQQHLQLISSSEDETRDIAKRVLLKHWNVVKETGVVIGLDGSLGMGKTIFTKGIAQFLQITDTITSPTYSYREEYDFIRHDVKGKLYHFDIWKIDGAAELERLDFAATLHPKSVVVIEWASQAEKEITAIAAAKKVPFIRVAITAQENQAHHDRILSIKEADAK